MQNGIPRVIQKSRNFEICAQDFNQALANAEAIPVIHRGNANTGISRFLNHKQYKYLSLLFACTIPSLLHCDETVPQDQVAYVEISSEKTQIPNPNEKSLIYAENVSLLKNFEISKDRTSLTCKVDGIYLIGSGTQVGILNPRVSGYIDSWFELNGAPIPASNSRQYISQSAEVALMTNAFLIELKVGDVIRTGFSASGPDIGIVAFTNLPNNEPDIVSFGISLFKIY